ncbi:MAG: hypothetical protein AAGL89_16855 [Pseudomonadota bacterium]
MTALCLKATLATLVYIIAQPAWSETPLTGEEFDDLTRGKTLTFSAGVAPYGTEYYGPDRQVIWAFNEDRCERGFWYDVPSETGTLICFEYEFSETAQCWQMFEVDGKLRADFMNVPGTTVLYEATETEPLICGGVGA